MEENYLFIVGVNEELRKKLISPSLLCVEKWIE